VRVFKRGPQGTPESLASGGRSLADRADVVRPQERIPARAVFRTKADSLSLPLTQGSGPRVHRCTPIYIGLFPRAAPRPRSRTERESEFVMHWKRHGRHTLQFRARSLITSSVAECAGGPSFADRTIYIHIHEFSRLNAFYTGGRHPDSVDA